MNLSLVVPFSRCLTILSDGQRMILHGRLSCSCRGYASRCLSDACSCTSVISQNQSPRVVDEAGCHVPATSDMTVVSTLSNQASLVNGPQHRWRITSGKPCLHRHLEARLSRTFDLPTYPRSWQHLELIIRQVPVFTTRRHLTRSHDQLSPTALSLFRPHLSFSCTSRRYRQRQKHDVQARRWLISWAFREALRSLYFSLRAFPMWISADVDLPGR
ncbi:hypothetical protein QBC41DRAFT_12267 [Cercophora samala]|uniref:Uncharacterized protein n=1 Tax=Cercophora samala TaxID=330535 RepID=A0AA40D8F2_9PEZI|nr:hypothetical protein QBC41DRAFT_12267 [Cercophora samala]